MKKKGLVFLAILLLCVSFAFAATGMKTLEFGPHKYTISELAPDFSKWNIGLLGTIEISPECSMWLFEGVNTDQTVMVRFLIVKEKKEVYLAGIIVMYVPEGKDPYGDCYEDVQYLGGGKPSFVLTKVDNPSDVDKFIQLKKMQFGKKVAI